MSPPLPGRVLVTGSSGNIGNIVVRHLLAAGIDTVALDQRPIRRGAATPHPLPTRYASITDRAALSDAFTGITQVVHLAANPNPYADLESQLITPNLVGVERVLQTAHDAGVRRVVLASSVQVADESVRPAPASTSHQSCDNWYGITKAAAELAGDMFHRNHGLDVLAARIGWFIDDTDNTSPWRERSIRNIHRTQKLDSYVSPGDLGRFFTAAVTAEWSGFHVLYAMSRPQRPDDPAYDLEPGQALIGYAPRDLPPDRPPDLPPDRPEAKPA
jgi:nucleoside-diphosphate-sugar epimerase